MGGGGGLEMRRRGREEGKEGRGLSTTNIQNIPVVSSSAQQRLSS